jgi:hypothetical protein
LKQIDDERKRLMRSTTAMTTLLVLSLLAQSGCVIVSDGDGGTKVTMQASSSGPPTTDERTVVLFAGKSWENWRHVDGSQSQWEIQDDRSILVKGGNAITAEEFGDFQLHIEFFCPPTDKEGQSKSNSGVYLHGRYEIQVLDSHGAAPANNLCGGIYQIATPLVNASKPPGTWQSFDVVFRGPRFDDAGKVNEQPRVTVMHNGITIHNNVILPNTTPGGIDREMVSKGPILLQDHGDPVRYRNIWLRKL